MISRNIVLVQGSWGSSAAWTPVADGLRRLGHRVFVPSLTGLGERMHLAGGHINLDTHIADVCGLIEAEGLADVDLVGHSSGGMVITGVADRFAERIRSLVYLDAFVPEDGQSILDLSGTEIALSSLAAAGENGGTSVPPPVRSYSRIPDHLRHYTNGRSAQPFATMVQKISLTGAYLKIARKLYVAAGIEQSAVFASTYARVGADPAWMSMQVESGHMMQLEMPDTICRIIDEFVG
ncbi:alpha/beta hydrolase [Rhizobium sp. S152]|uniref:alpha/beta fold hydrolase n=1 Tax=Rhizobium sp. S152 TaxID=3055038 RepID=UPI0025A9C8F9|nr:alpha/beta hydrolase [Rhizobium sp. S152]MDM9628172.1 alpha/beta hydrolase [Rhizobium sp. S152]